MNSAHKFAVDKMLGRLAKWLRLLGYDTFYKNKIKPVTLLSIAQSENRIIVTKNRYFLKHPFPVPILFLNTDTLEKQLLEIDDKYPLQKNKAFSRCPLCNNATTPVEKENIKKLVPEYVFRTHECFHQCIHCGKIYWRGTHPQRALAFLEKIGLKM
ncbi:MAG: Mut7-C RNAse domain-containing protein [Candidatus Celaenobacter antarcticus]|nr:Mut7-C RNAse domain-containing protein [Candidatus Celaenobacter antarcticus]MDP8315567.1 Mut7-C RNAse domain-containing protein [Candidatus Celaenobacter antarcticus]